MNTPRPVTNYWDYLRLDSLLSLQAGLDADGTEASTAEMHFIIVHQIFELSFKLILRELRTARDGLVSRYRAALPDVLRHLDRTFRALSSGTAHWDLIESLTQQEFLSFRDKLAPASGAQSFQFPEMEIVLGLEDALAETGAPRRPLMHIRGAASCCPAGAVAWERVERSRGECTLRRALYDWLYETEICGSRPQSPGDALVIDNFADEYVKCARTYHQRVARCTRQTEAAASGIETYLKALDAPAPDRTFRQRMRAALIYIETYGEATPLAAERELIEKALALEEALLLWRARHMRAVERLIGQRIGTGGSSLNHLEQTMCYRVFGDLWAVRSQLLPRCWAPELGSFALKCAASQ